MREPTAAVACSIWRRHGVADATRIIPEEAAIAHPHCAFYLDPMIAGPEGGPSSDMQRYEG